MESSDISHSIKHRVIANDEFYTPPQLARNLIELCPLKMGQTVLDSAYGTGNFYNNFPDYTINYYTKHFEKWTKPVGWIVSNPPYSLLNKWWLTHTQKLALTGYAYLIGQGHMTCKRIEEANIAGFGLVGIHMCKVFKWYGMSYFVIFEKGKHNIISYDRKVWR